MHPIPTEMIEAIVIAIFASSGFWMFINNIYQAHKEKKSVERRALLGLLHEQLTERCEKYIKQGYITLQDYEDLLNYIYKPYRDLGGNGTGEALFNKVTNLGNQPPETLQAS